LAVEFRCTAAHPGASKFRKGLAVPDPGEPAGFLCINFAIRPAVIRIAFLARVLLSDAVARALHIGNPRRPFPRAEIGFSEFPEQTSSVVDLLRGGLW
jgi:hypothetical protein